MKKYDVLCLVFPLVCLTVLVSAGSPQSVPAIIGSGRQDESRRTLAAPLLTFTVSNTDDSGMGSLREALDMANLTPGLDAIAFNIPGPGPHTIQPMTPLPMITDPVIIDGETEPNFAGTPVIELDGSMAGSAANGLVISAGNTLVRGLAINRFASHGIVILSVGGNVIQGNFIGADISGTMELGNGGDGLLIVGAPGNIIGGSALGQRNLISGNALHGIEIMFASATANIIQGNLIGTAINGISPLGNGAHGVFVAASASDNLIGAPMAGRGNTIAFNSGGGVVVDSGGGNAVLSDAIFSNGGLGIDLGDDGVSPNDLDDVDAGANDVQNFPVLASVTTGSGNTIIQGSLNSTAGTAFQLEFFVSPVCDPSGFGEGQTPLGITTVTTNAMGTASFTAVFPVAVPLGQFITATATDPGNNTSEFSRCLGTLLNQPPVAICRDVTISANASCQAVVSPAQVDNGSFDPDSDSLTFSLTPPGPYRLGTTEAVLSVTDDKGATTVCPALVTVIDTAPPLLTCPAAITLLAGPSGLATFNLRAMAIDNCDRGLRITSDPPLPARFDLGVHTVTYTATDDFGNRFTCTTEVTVIDEFRVARVFPINGALNVPLESSIEVQFNAPLVPASVQPSTLMLTTADGTRVAGGVVAVGNRAFFSPSDPLPTQTTFIIRVIGGAAGVMGLINREPVSLARDFVGRFTTEPAQMEPPSDGRFPVRADMGGTVMDDAGTGAAVTVAEDALKTDTVVTIEVATPTKRLLQIDNDCDAPLSSIPLDLSVAGFERVSDIVRYASEPCGAVAFSPGMDLTFPMQPAFRRRFPPNTALRVFQLVQTEAEPAFRDTGIEAEVTGAGDFAIAAGVEVFGTFALFVSVGQNVSWSVVRGPWSVAHGSPERTPDSKQKTTYNGQQTTDSGLLFFPVIEQRSGRATRLSLANPDRDHDRTVVLTALNDDGTNHGTRRLVLSKNQQTDRLVSDLFPGLRSGTIMAEADGPVTGFYEMADNFAAPRMLDGAEAIRAPMSAMVFPLIRTSAGASTEIHLFNPGEAAVQVRLTAFRSDGSRVALNKDQQLMIIESRQGAVTSSAVRSPVTPPFSQFDGGTLYVETVGGGGMVGAEVIEEVLAGERNLAIVNAVELPAGCVPTGTGSCRIDESVPAAARQHSGFAVHLEADPVLAEAVLVNISDRDARVALSALDSTGRFLGSQPRGVGQFFVLRPQAVMRQPVRSLFGFNPGQTGGYLRVEDPDSAVVGVIINRDAMQRKFLTALPLATDLAQQGREVTEALFSRIQIDSAAPGAQTGLFILNPNSNAVRLKIIAVDGTGAIRESSQTLVGRGSFLRARLSLSVLFPGLTSGYCIVEAQPDPTPATGERLIPFVLYRSTEYLSAVPQQRRQQ
jgi:hypothetical protein